MGETRARIQPDKYSDDVNSGAKWLSGALLLAALGWGSWITLQMMNMKTDLALTMDRHIELKAYLVKMEQNLDKIATKLESHK